MNKLYVVLLTLLIALNSVNSVCAEEKPLKLSPEMQKAMQSNVKNLDDGLTNLERVEKYVVSGFLHILPKGLDHILFVLGIFLSTVMLKPLIIQVTVFTLAHSVTLGLASVGLIVISPSIVEPLIALSIVYLGVENIRHKEPKQTRIAVIFIFGLLHGLGFAYVLQDFGLPSDAFLLALLSFNVGVELGQLAVLIFAYVILMKWRHISTFRKRVQIPSSMLIAGVGAFWFIERTLL